jgi:hypothetical protein
MSPTHQDDDEPDFSRKKQTFFLSAEFLVTMLVQSAVFLVVGTTVLNGITARVVALESQQVTAERIARIEEKLGTMISNQQEAKMAITRVQDELRSQRRD